MNKGTIVIVHGLFMNPLVMRPLALMLRAHGWRTYSVGYQTTKIDKKSFFSRLNEIKSKHPLEPIHFVGHSLGGLMLRSYCSDCANEGGARLVTLGTPHQGAEIVSRLDHYKLGFIIGNSREHGLIRNNGQKWESEVEVGTIAGNVDTGMLNILGGQRYNERSDGIVLVNEAKIEGSKDHIEVNSSHTTLIYSKIVSYHINNFIENGLF